MKRLVVFLALLIFAALISSCATAQAPGGEPPVVPAVPKAEGITVLVSCCDGRADQIWPLDPQGTGSGFSLANTEVRVYRRIASAISSDFQQWVWGIEVETGLPVKSIIYSTHGIVKDSVCLVACGGEKGIAAILSNAESAKTLAPELQVWLPFNVTNEGVFSHLKLELQELKTMFPQKELVGNFWAHNSQTPLAVFYQPPNGQSTMISQADFDAGKMLDISKVKPSAEVTDYFAKMAANNAETAAAAARLKFGEMQGFKKVVLNGTNGVPLPKMAPNMFSGADSAFEITLTRTPADAVAQATFAMKNLVKSGGDLVIVLPKSASQELLLEVVRSLNKSGTFLELLRNHGWVGAVDLMYWDGVASPPLIMLRAPSQSMEALTYTPRIAAAIPPVAPTVLAAATKRQLAPGDRPLKSGADGWSVVSDEAGVKLEVQLAGGQPTSWRWTYKNPTKVTEVFTAFKAELAGDPRVKLTGNSVEVPELGMTFTERRMTQGWLNAEAEWNQAKQLALKLRASGIYVDPDPRFAGITAEGKVVFLDFSSDYAAASQWMGKDAAVWFENRANTLWGAWLDERGAAITKVEMTFVGKRPPVSQPSKFVSSVLPTVVIALDEKVQYRVVPEFVFINPTQRITLQKYDPAMMKFGWTGAGTKEVAIQMTATGGTNLLGIPKDWPLSKITPQLLADLGAPMSNAGIAARIGKYLSPLGEGAMQVAGYAGAGYIFMRAADETFGWGSEVTISGSEALLKKPSEDVAVQAALANADLLNSPLNMQLNGGSHDGVLSLFRRRQNRPYPLMMANTSHDRLLTITGFMPDDIATGITVLVRDDLGTGRPALVYVNQVSGEIVEWRFDAIPGGPRWTQWVVDDKGVAAYQPDGGKCMSFSALIPGWDAKKKASAYFSGQFQLCWPNGIQTITPLPITKF